MLNFTTDFLFVCFQEVVAYHMEAVRLSDLLKNVVNQSSSQISADEVQKLQTEYAARNQQVNIRLRRPQSAGKYQPTNLTEKFYLNIRPWAGGKSL